MISFLFKSLLKNLSQVVWINDGTKDDGLKITLFILYWSFAHFAIKLLRICYFTVQTAYIYFKVECVLYFDMVFLDLKAGRVELFLNFMDLFRILIN